MGLRVVVVVVVALLTGRAAADPPTLEDAIAKAAQSGRPLVDF